MEINFTFWRELRCYKFAQYEYAGTQSDNNYQDHANKFSRAVVFLYIHYTRPIYGVNNKEKY